MIDVTAAVISKNGLVLIARRAKGKHLEGFWEFPGGKLEPGENPEECLAREIREELKVDIVVEAFLMESIYDYGDKVVRLFAYDAKHASGQFELIEHDSILWVSPQELSNFKLAPADVPIAEFLESKILF